MRQRIAGYEVVERLYVGPSSVVYSALSPDAARRVVIKTTANDYPSEAEMARLRREHQMVSRVAHPNVVRSLGLEPWEHGMALVLEQAPGVTLEEHLDGKPMPTAAFLRVAAPLAAALAAVHEADVVHKDVSPQNILVHGPTGDVRLIDFDLSSPLPRQARATRNPDALEGTLAYMAPEQTGRTNLGLDHRADLYSLGAVFFHMLTGAPPFTTVDPLELIHRHLATQPPSPAALVPGVPDVLAQMVLRLLRKNPDQRYQSAAGVLADLETCAGTLTADDQVADFPLGRRDVSPWFRLPQTLYGREAEAARLAEAFERTADSPRLMLVTGYAGVGKSRLIGELRGTVLRRHGFFVAGKFDQLNRSVPFASLHGALRELARQLLTENDGAVAEWRQRLLEAFGPNGRLITDVIPEIEWIIGEQKPVAALPARESQNRFLQVFRAFLGVFCRPEHPLCLFLDDLQWVDPATLTWLQTTLTDRSVGSLLVVGAYRDDEVTGAHPLMVVLDHLAERGAPIERIELGPLPPDSLGRFVADALRAEGGEADELAGLIYGKTQGNPFFAGQLLLSLHDDGVLRYDPARLQWTCDLARVAARASSENVVGLLLERIHRLGGGGQEALKAAACIGNVFPLALLAEAAGQPESALEAPLAEAVQSGLLSATEEAGGYRFSHDRVQQATLEMIPPDQTQRLHLRIGRLLLARSDRPETDAGLFEALSHFQGAEGLVTDAEERQRLAALNLAAATRSRDSTAYAQALQQAETAARLLGDSAPELLRFRVTLEHAQCEGMVGHDEVAERLYRRAEAHAPDDAAKAQVFESHIHYLTNRGSFEQAYAQGRAAAAVFGVALPPRFVPGLLLKDLAQIYGALRGRPVLGLAEMAPMRDERLLVGARLATAAMKAAYQIRPELCVASGAAIVSLCLRRGNFEDCAVAYMPVSIFQIGVLGHHGAGYQWGRLGLALQERYANHKQKAEVHFVYAYFAHSWVHPLETTEDHYRTAYQAGIETGDFFHAGCAASGLIQNMHMRGVPMDAVVAECGRYREFLEQVGARENIGTLQAVQQTVRNLRGQTNGRTSFSEDGFDEEEYAASLREYGSKHFAHFYLVNKLQAMYLWREYGTALTLSERSAAYLPASIGMQHAAEHHFFTALLYADLYALRAPGPRLRWRRTVRTAAAKFSRWAKRCPANFEHKALLLAAELARIEGRDTPAAVLYDAAIEAARRDGFLQNEALASELAGRFHAAHGRDRMARFYLRDAAHGYRRWGATALADALPERYGDLMPAAGTEAEATPSRTYVSHKTVKGGVDFDLETVLRAAEAISGQVQLPHLLTTLLTLVMENAGADRGLLLLPQGGDYVIQAEGSADSVAVMQAVPLSGHDAIARSVVGYVVRSRTSVVLDDARQPGLFSSDPYLRADGGPQSLLCAPLLNRGVLSGVLYLENRLTAGAFTESRQGLLLLLSAQFAISIENALAYEVLEQRVRERTQQLEARNELIRQIFGRYISAEVVDRLLQAPTGLKMGGERREVTVLMADMRGFTALMKALTPEQVVQLINNFLGVMTEVIIRYGGTSDFTGDGAMVFFNAPTDQPDHAADAVACAVAMQFAVSEVNAMNADMGLPAIGIGIGVSTGDVVAGNIGSLKRAKYSVMGIAVNLAARIESYTTSGQVLISERTRQAAGDILEIVAEMDFEPKGAGRVHIFEVCGIGGEYGLRLPQLRLAPVPLARALPIRMLVLQDKHTVGEAILGRITGASDTAAHVQTERGSAEAALPPLTDITFRLVSPDGSESPVPAFAKVMPEKVTQETQGEGPGRAPLLLHFTSVPEEVREALRNAALAISPDQKENL